MTDSIYGKEWTEEELAIVRARYPDEENEDIAADLGRTPFAVRGCANRQGLRKSPAFMRRKLARDTWSEEDIATLKARYGVDSVPEIARDLGYAVQTVYSKAFKLGLKDSGERPHKHHVWPQEHVRVSVPGWGCRV